MRVVGYIRVSSRTQAEDGLGLEIQQEAITAWCEANGHTLVAVHRDAGISGTKEQVDRPGLRTALLALDDGQADGLLVYRLDRLSRLLYIQETVIAQLGKRGQRVMSVQESDIVVAGADPIRDLVRQVLGAISQYERALIQARMAAGRQAKHARGGYAGYGAPSFGFQAVAGELVEHPTEQRALARVAELHAMGLSLRVIARVLDAEGLKPKRAERWHAKTVARLLERIQPPAEQHDASITPIRPAAAS